MENSTHDKYFEDMIEYLKFYDLTVDEFKNYYLRLNYAVEKGFIKRPLKYILALLNTKVKPILTGNDEEIFNFVKMGLSDLMLQTLKDPNNSKMLDDYYREEFAKMERNISLDVISFDMFEKYYYLINIAMAIPTNSTEPIKMIKLIRILLNVNMIMVISKESERFSQMKENLTKKYFSLLSSEINDSKTR